MPELFQRLRGVIDRGRRRGTQNGQFLLLGSAAMDLLRQSGESLAGRISYLELLGIRDKETLLGHPVVGPTWQSFAIETLIAAAPDATEAHFYRTANGNEVDLVLTLPGGKLWAIEIKRSSVPKLERGFHLACADLKPNTRFVVYPGNERFPLDADTDAIGLADLGRALQAIK